MALQLLVGVKGKTPTDSIRLGFWHREQDWEASNSIRPLTSAIGERNKLATIYGGGGATPTRNKPEQSGRERIKGLCAL